MNNPPLPSGTAAGLCAVFILLIPFAAVGLSLMNAGLTRTRSVAHTFFGSLLAIAVAAVTYFICGFGWQGPADTSGAVVHALGKSWDWIGVGPFLLRGAALGDASVLLLALFGMLSVGLATLIPLGTGAERWRLAAMLASNALLAGLTFPLLAHWVWGSGWLRQLGNNFGLGRGFVDIGGSGCIQALGGLTALPVAWILGPRRGKYNSGGMPMATPGHNAAFVLAGCLLSLVGWLGLNSAGAMLFAGSLPEQTPLIAVNTVLAACGGILSAAATTRMRFGKPDASLCANGWITGLAASSAGTFLFRPAEALFVGLVAGAIVIFAIELLELRMKVDDPAGAISVHATGGLWGLLATGLLSGTGQLVAQLVGIATILGVMFPLTYSLNWGLSRFVRFRVAPEGERQGMDLFELGAGAYPEFMIHRDDSPFR